jgi:hypothetical protein
MYRKTYAQTAQDIHFSIGDTGIKLIFACILGIGIMTFIACLNEKADESKSTSWPVTQASLQEIGNQPMSTPIIGQFLPVVCPYAKYTYTIDNKVYVGEKVGGPSLSPIRAFLYKPPQPKTPVDKEVLKNWLKQTRESIEREKDIDPAKTFQGKLERSADRLFHPRPTYDLVKVRYQADQPEISVLDPEVLQSEKTQMYTSFILIAIGGLLLGGLFYHQYVTAPNPDDPFLSLEAALAAQRRRKR